MTRPFATGLPGGHSEWEPPDPFSNSEVKTLCADASVDFVDVKVGHCQALNLMKTKPSTTQVVEGFFVSLLGRRHRQRIRHLSLPDYSGGFGANRIPLLIVAHDPIERDAAVHRNNFHVVGV